MYLIKIQCYIWRKVGRKCQRVAFLIFLTLFEIDRLTRIFIGTMVFKVIKRMI